MADIKDLTDEDLLRLDRKIPPSIRSLSDEQLLNESKELEVQRILSPAKPTQLDAFTKAGDKLITGIAEPLLTLGSGFITEAGAGIGGLAKTITSGPEEGEETINRIREAGTFRPRTESGREGLGVVQKVLGPIGEGAKFLEQKAGDIAFEASGGDPLAGAGGSTVPAIVEQLLGARVAKLVAQRKINPNSRIVSKAIRDKSASTQLLRKESTKLFDGIKASGGEIKGGAVNQLVEDINTAAVAAGAGESTPAIQGLLNEVNGLLGEARTTLNPITGIREASNLTGPITIQRLLELRKQTQRVMKDPVSTGIGVEVMDEIDNFIINADESNFRLRDGSPLASSEIGPTHELARSLYGRAKRGESIQEIIQKAEDNTTTSLDTSIRKQLGQLIDNPRKSRFLTKNDVKEIRTIVNSNPGTNMMRFVAKLGFSPTQQSNLFGGVIGFAIGEQIGKALGVQGGGFTLLATGSITRAILDVMAKGRARFAEAVVRAGPRGRDVVAAYNKFVPRGRQTAEDLSMLLLREDIDLNALRGIKVFNRDLIDRAAVLTAERRQALLAAAATGAGAQTAQENR